MHMKIIAFDLDFTLLDSAKRLSKRNIAALKAAKRAGIEPVVATGRLYKGVPDTLKDICRYHILINGAKVYDSKENKIIYEAAIPQELALSVYEYADTFDCLYDAYIEDSGIMTSRMLDRFDDYVADKNYAVSQKALRKGVSELKRYIREASTDVQKAQLYFKTVEEKDAQLAILPDLFPDLKFSCSLGQNIEINHKSAGKGVALEALCKYLGYTLKETVAFGDGTNDTEMIQYAGTGYCMINGDDTVKKIADRITEFDCDSDGVGIEIEKILT